MTQPDWWPQVLAATSKRRIAAGMLLAHATPTVHDGALQLEFDRDDVAAAWEESGAQAALEGAMAYLGHPNPVRVSAPATAENRAPDEAATPVTISR
ncbi:hypothetical protein PV755_09470 [Streptomyces caniscabiei]|uniref:Uncharacterized protein n=1 Tax=Streptomyces caniscabiei TaxID=2746961 RepID=A0A927L181_9ACTN|nr:hypothetical protein [Streptomyces caniscabiei]MBD9721959.1 hypothetical protein [Streptomyces caniscabiei]MDX3509151.1 hypothetical protein [Streptomyces caniscabiei]MDX3717096.1 hypothetical protein [Streptomyces caniscabiei]WEO22964.1 hypothetical protein IHE65_07255 [Streptomyces caniscabiei]